MNSSEIEHKIRKYTVKLQSAESTESADIYQRKLDYYQKLVQDGGDFFTNIQKQIQAGKKDMAKIQKTIGEAKLDLKSMDNLGAEVKKTGDEFNTMVKSSLEAGQAVGNMAGQLKGLQTASEEFQQNANKDVAAKTAAIEQGMKALKLDETGLSAIMSVTNLVDGVVSNAQNEKDLSKLVAASLKTSEITQLLSTHKAAIDANATYKNFLMESFNGNLDDLKGLITSDSKKATLLVKDNAFLKEISGGFVGALNAIVPADGTKASFTFVDAKAAPSANGSTTASPTPADITVVHMANKAVTVPSSTPPANNNASGSQQPPSTSGSSNQKPPASSSGSSTQQQPPVVNASAKKSPSKPAVTPQQQPSVTPQQQPSVVTPQKQPASSSGSQNTPASKTTSRPSSPKRQAPPVPQGSTGSTGSTGSSTKK